MKYNHTCNLCSDDDWKEIFKTRDYLTQSETEFSLLRCNNCGLYISYPQPSPDEISKYYPDKYYSYTEKSLNFPNGFMAKKLKRIFGDRYHYFPSPKMPVGSAFEIGCSKGYHLKALQQLGWEVSGIDMYEDAIRYAKKEFGLNVLLGDFQQTDIPENSYDLVQAMMVMEHLYDIKNALEKISKIIKSGGLFIFNVPNHGSLERRIFGKKWFAYEIPRHLFHYDVNSISKFLEQAGFSIEKLYYEKIPLTITTSLQSILNTKYGKYKIGRKIANWFALDSRAAFVTFYPFSFLLALFCTSGNMVIHARKK